MGDNEEQRRQIDRDDDEDRAVSRSMGLERAMGNAVHGGSRGLGAAALEAAEAAVGSSGRERIVGEVGNVAEDELNDNDTEGEEDDEEFVIEDLRDDLQERLTMSQMPQLSLFAKMFTFLGRVVTPMERKYFAAQRGYYLKKVNDKGKNAEVVSGAVVARKIQREGDSSQEPLEERESRSYGVPIANDSLRNRKQILSKRLLKSLQSLRTEFGLPISNADDLSLYQQKYMEAMSYMDLASASSNTIGFSSKELKLLCLVILILFTVDVVDTYEIQMRAKEGEDEDGSETNATHDRANGQYQDLFEFRIFESMAEKLVEVIPESKGRTRVKNGSNQDPLSNTTIDGKEIKVDDYYKDKHTVLDAILKSISVNAGQFKILLGLFKR